MTFIGCFSREFLACNASAGAVCKALCFFGIDHILHKVNRAWLEHYFSKALDTGILRLLKFKKLFYAGVFKAERG
jgi:hypothetical protein